MLEQLSDTNEKYYEMTSRKKEDLKKQQVQGDYELVILDRMSRKQTLESLEVSTLMYISVNCVTESRYSNTCSTITMNATKTPYHLECIL